MSVEPYYADEWVTLYHGDCREVDAWLDADVLVTDPPYGIGYTNRRGEVVHGDSDFSTTTAALAPALEEFVAVAVFASHASLFRTAALVAASHERCRFVTWHKTNVNGAAGMGNPWMADVEFAVCGVREWPKRSASGLVCAPRSTGNPEWQKHKLDAYLHPTQKPLTVMEHVISCLPPGIVADPFAGSGSTLVAAKRLGRKAIGIELEERYCEIAAKRLAQGVLDFGGAT